VQGQLRVRPYRSGDSAAVAPILYESSGGLYDRYAGSRKLAERTIARALEREGSTASGEVVWVAELDGQTAGAMAAMAFVEWTARAHAFLRTTLRTIPPWRWPGALWIYQAGGRGGAGPPDSSFYVDSLATAEPFRRRGVAAALLAHAEHRALELGLDSVALETWVDNHAALALYRGAGFKELGRTRGRSGLPGGVLLLKEVT
jgi:ribosomal protein S18 acetylase RimI-like enzyme